MKIRKKRKKLGIFLIALVIIALGAIYLYAKWTYSTYMNMDLSFATPPGVTATTDSFTAPIEKVGDLKTYYEKAHSINNGVIGWIAIPGTNINYPINFGKGDNYYLDHNWRGDSYWNGSVFLSQNNIGGFGNVSLINGHNMLNGIMFSQLLNFDNKNIFDSKNIYIYNGQSQKIEEFKPIVAMYCEPSIAMTLGDLSKEERTKEVNELMKNSMYGTKTYNGNNVVLLNTCLSNGSGKHFLLAAEQVN
ncbi:MAG: class B sortase [Sarcina sp.]